MVKNSSSLWIIYAYSVFFHWEYDTLLCLSFSCISSKPGNYPVRYSLSKVNRLFCSSRSHSAKASSPWKDGARSDGCQNPFKIQVRFPLGPKYWPLVYFSHHSTNCSDRWRRSKRPRRNRTGNRTGRNWTSETNVDYTKVFLRWNRLDFVRIHTLVIPHHNLPL